MELVHLVVISFQMVLMLLVTEMLTQMYFLEVVLHRGINASKPSGIFTCNIPDVNINNQKIYFGIYASEEGTPLLLHISTRIILSNNLCKLSRNMLYCIFYRVYYIY